MDPRTALQNAINGDLESAKAYNEWTENGGFTVAVKAWMPGERVPQIIDVRKVGPKLVRGTLGVSSRNTTALVISVTEVM